MQITVAASIFVIHENAFKSNYCNDSTSLYHTYLVSFVDNLKFIARFYFHFPDSSFQFLPFSDVIIFHNFVLVFYKISFHVTALWHKAVTRNDIM